jgi:hypothetical protein
MTLQLRASSRRCHPMSTPSRVQDNPRSAHDAELEAIALGLSAMYRPLPAFAAATGLQPEE